MLYDAMRCYAYDERCSVKPGLRCYEYDHMRCYVMLVDAMNMIFYEMLFDDDV